MNKETLIQRLRWAARVWSLIVLIIAILIFALPDPEQADLSLAINERIELGFIGLSVLGLLLAWRWELFGGLLAIGGFIGFLITFYVERGWLFPGFLLFAVILILPASAFIACWRLSRQTGSQKITTERQRAQEKIETDQTP